MRPTMKDVAKLAGVSTATVSNVLTSKKYVSPELEKKVRNAMHKLNYRPNPVARSLRLNKTRSIGVIAPDIMNPFFSEIIKNIEEVTDMKEYDIVFCNSDEDPKKERRILQTFLNSGIDGIINITSRLQDKDLNIKMPMPMVIVDRPHFDTNENIFFVYADNFLGGSLVADHLVEEGYKKFICIAGPVEKAPVAKKRLDGFRNKLFSYGFQDSDLEIHTCKFSFDDGFSVMSNILETYDKSERKAAFVPSDIMAWGAVQACNAFGVKIPDDIAIVGYDNIWLSGLINPGLTTVENPTVDLGKESASMLIDVIETEERFYGNYILLDPLLIKRRTT